MSNGQSHEAEVDWRAERKKGMAAIAAGVLVGGAVWLALDLVLPPLAGMGALSARMFVALKCIVLATLFCLMAGIEAVAHERLQSAAFDPLQNVETKRLRVNQRYLQNTLEEIVVFAVGLAGLAAYASDGRKMRAVIATTVVWIFCRFAFWVGYHYGAAWRGLGALGLALPLILLLFVSWRIGNDLAGVAGGWALVIIYLFVEASLFWLTRDRPEPGQPSS